jgi:hypothetical protein
MRTRMSLKRLRVGELIALAGVACAVLSLFEPSYHRAVGSLGAWDTFGPAVALLIVAVAAALVLVVGTVTERSTAVPVAAAVWGVLLGLAAVIATLVRLLERPEHATSPAVGAWLGLVGAVGMLAGAWLSIADERTSLYEPASPEPCPPP